MNTKTEVSTCFSSIIVHPFLCKICLCRCEIIAIWKEERDDCCSCRENIPDGLLVVVLIDVASIFLIIIPFLRSVLAWKLLHFFSEAGQVEFVFVSYWQMYLSYIDQCICVLCIFLKLQNVCVLNGKMYLFQIPKCTSLKLQN